MGEVQGNGAAAMAAWENKLKLWSWRFIIIVAIAALSYIWKSVESKIDDQGSQLAVAQKQIGELQRDKDKEVATIKESLRNIEYRTERIERKLDKALD